MGSRRAWLGAAGLALVACAAAPPPAARLPPPPPAPKAVAKSSVTVQKSPEPEAPRCQPLSVTLPELVKSDLDVPVPELVDFSGHEQMSRFYERLATLLRHEADDSVRIAFYGDSNMTRDFISGELRRVLQATFGDGGHGYIAVGKPWSWYIHTDVRHGADPVGWKTFNMSTDQLADRLYGFAGLAAQNRSDKARAWIETAGPDAPVGKSVSRVDVLYLTRPGAGSFRVLVDGRERAVVDTAADRVEAKSRRFDMPDGPHRIDFESGKGTVRVLGAVLERTAPGVVVDSLGIGGVNSELLARGDRALAVQTLRMHEPDLVLLLTGATEPDSAGHMAALRELIERHAEAAPDAPFVVMSPPDVAGGTIQKPTKVVRIGQIAKQDRAVAEAEKSMFWDFRGAMGGEQSIVRFAERKMAWKDFIHLTESGGRTMGRRFAYALMRDFSRYLEAHPEAGCKPSGVSQK